MVVSRDGKRWKFSVRIGGREGKRIRRTGFETKSEAQRAERDSIIEYEQNSNLFTGKNFFLSDLLSSWYLYHGQTLKCKRRYVRLIKMVERMNNPSIQDLSVKNFLDYRGKRLNEGVSPQTINLEFSYMKSVFNELNSLDVYQGENLLNKIKPISVDQKELTYLDHDQIAHLLKVCRYDLNTSLYPVTLICLSTGARWSEAQLLTGAQVKVDRITFDHTKSGKSRTIPIDKSIYDVLLPFVTTPLARLFIDCYDDYRRVYRKIGFFGQTPGQMTHILRHSFASHFVMNGGSIMTLQKVLGHSTILMTMRYAHLAPDHLKDVLRFGPFGNESKLSPIVET